MSCLLAIDIGNTNTVLGVFRGPDLVAHWRVTSDDNRTSDEWAILLRQLGALGDYAGNEIDRNVDQVIVASVVPPTLRALDGLASRHLSCELLVVGPGIKTGMPILYESPRDVGADRIVNAVAAYEITNQGCIVVDFGTATTWDVVTPKGEYLGGAIAPGIGISAQALYQRASKLPRIEIVRPDAVVGRTPTTSMQSGLVFGYASMVDGMVERIRDEVQFPVKCLATGGLAPLIAAESNTIELTDELLTLTGLKILADRNR